MGTKKVVGMRIKSLRRARDYSQERLAEIMGINPKYLSSIERGEENPTLDLLIRLSQGLKVEMHEIFNLEYEGQPPQILRRKLQGLLGEIKEEDLTRAIRILSTFVR